MYSTPTAESKDGQQPRTQSLPNLPPQEPEKKPKKPNSELRKQQNRIASRNYREKRKRKLQYLQQLIKDGGSADEQSPEPVAEQSQGQRTISPEYYAPIPVAPNMTLPSNDHNYSAFASSSAHSYEPAMVTTASLPIPSYQTHYHPTLAQSYPPFEQPMWSSPNPLYDIPPPVNVSAWNMPNWMSNIEFSPPMTTRSADDFHFTPPPPLAYDSFEQRPTPPRQAHTPDPEYFMAGSYAQCWGRQDQSMGQGTSSMSLPSSPFCHPRYP